ncbi:MAG: glycosyl hydrolase [Cytophagales bacterium CG18_big_fil_WC_8_21_14_2_50_42_9]|nr:MAG: glycosyl hydrolase [Cytophagales bacterium CG18_big_fil_WC_8_21_14_2_50_42_9]
MKKLSLLSLLIVLFASSCSRSSYVSHPNTAKSGWQDLFKPDLSNAINPKNIWTYDNGVLTASEDLTLWSDKEYTDFSMDLEFKTASGTNSGVVVHASNTDNWIPNSVEIQIADDYSEEWSKAPATWQCGAIFGRKAPVKSNVKRPGEWNRYTVTCKDKLIWVVLNGELVNQIDMSLWTDPKKNPDGTEIPAWLNKPLATLPLQGHVGLQGKHAGAPIYFRNIKIKEIK